MTTTDDPRRAVLADYCALFAALEPGRLDELRVLCTADIRFADPFQEIRGIDRYVELYAHMYRTVADPRFAILDSALGARTGFIRWRFEGALKGRAFAVDGVSEVGFDAVTARICEHVDHWDAAGQVYGRLPVVGAALRGLRRLFAAGA